MQRLSRAKQLRELAYEQRLYVKSLSAELTEIPKSEYPPFLPEPSKVWRSRDYLVMLFSEKSPNLRRLTVCRSTLGKDGRWQDGLTWDELQDIKRAVGFGDTYAIEVYPRDCDMVNVANMRHLWLLAEPLEIGWR